jgi:hypothetical protein
MQTSQELWKALGDILQVDLSAKRDRSGVAKLNRLARKGFPEIRNAKIEFNPESSYIELLENQSLQNLCDFRCAHSDKGARREGGPLVVIQYEGVNYIIDGTHRINSWQAIGFAGRFSVIRISLKRR